MKQVDFDDYSASYNRLLAERTGFFSTGTEYFARYKVDLVRAQVRPPVKRLLEYGCGIGRNIPFIQNAFPNATIVGSDISQASLAIARRDNPTAEFFRENESPAAIEPFDVIFVAGVFHHIPASQRISVAKTLCSRLSPDGRLFVFEHNPLNPLTRRIVRDCPYDADAVLLKPSELQGILAAAALTVERHAYCLFAPPRFPLLARLERRLGWLPFGGQYWLRAKRSI